MEMLGTALCEEQDESGQSICSKPAYRIVQWTGAQGGGGRWTGAYCTEHDPTIGPKESIAVIQPV